MGQIKIGKKYMSCAEIKHVTSAEIITVESLLAEQGVEQLIVKQRVPEIIRNSSNASDGTYWCIIPPKGTKKGDSYSRGIRAGSDEGFSAVLFYSEPGHLPLGFADCVEINESQAQVLEARIKKAVSMFDATTNFRN